MKRIQRRRVKGWHMPANAISICRPTRWGNPFRIGFDCKTRNEAVDCYRTWLFAKGQDALKEFLRPLRGKDLACWCSLNQACHADVLIHLIKDYEKMGLFDHSMEELRKQSVDRFMLAQVVVEQLKKEPREPVQVSLEAFQ